MNFDIGSIIALKMMNGIMKEGDLDVGKLALMQMMTSGKPIQISDVMRTKLMSALAKDDSDLETLPLDKLMLYQMLSDGKEIDINQVIQMKLVSKLLNEDEESAKK